MINFDKRNYRKHNQKNKELIKKSLKECGAGRSIVIDSEDNIIAGNGIYEQAQSLKIPTKIVETDGNELVVVKRTDLKTNDDKRKQLAVMDNSTSDSSEFDFELLAEDFDGEQLGEFGIKKILKDDEENRPEVEFTEELLEEHNYIVLYFDNSVDWLQAQSVFNLKSVRSLNPKLKQVGVGRVLNGSEVLNSLLGVQ